MNEDLNQLLDTLRGALERDDPARARQVVDGVHAADLAELMPLLDAQQQSQLIYLLPSRTAAEVVISLDDAERADVVEDLDSGRVTEIVTSLQPDDAADMVADLPEEQREEVLDRIPEEQSEKIEDLLDYPEDTAGGIMTPDLVALPASATVGQAADMVRQASEDEDIHYVYVVDQNRRLFGLVPLRRLVTNPHDKLLSDICERDVVSAGVHDDQERVAQKMAKYDVSAVPVVDQAGRLVGRITHDDILDVAEQEAAEDLYYMAGTDPTELDETSSARAAWVRLRWLMACLAGTALSGLIMLTFEGAFSPAVFLCVVPFVPMMGAMGGNSGIQVSTIIVRGFATGELASSRLRYTFSREARIALIMAPVCGVLAASIAAVEVRLGLFTSVDFFRLAVAVGTGMTAAILLASFLGISMPHLFRRFGVDPAIASGPIVTTTNDIVSATTYYLIAMAIIR